MQTYDTIEKLYIMVSSRVPFQDDGMATLSGASYKPRGTNGDLDSTSLEMTESSEILLDIDSVHDHVLADLAGSGMEFVKNFTSTIRAKQQQLYEFEDGEQLDWQNVFERRDNESTILHQIVTALRDDLSLDPDAVRQLTECLVQEHPGMIIDRDENGKNVLELAVSYKNCQGVIEAICEHGMVQVVKKPIGDEIAPRGSFAGTAIVFDQSDEVRTIEKDGETSTVEIEWKQLMHRGESPLHMAIRKNRNDSALYLLGRMQITGDHEYILDCPGDDGLSPLHLAVDYKMCSAERVKLVNRIIEIYPDALSVQSEAWSLEKRKHRDSGHIKDGLSPYKHFIESREQRNSRSMSSKVSQHLTKEREQAANQIMELLRLGCMRRYGRNRAQITRLLDTKVSLIVILLIPDSSNSIVG